MPCVPIFTFACLLLTYLVWSRSDWLPYLSSEGNLYTGLTVVAASGVLTLSPRVHYRFGYDLFSFGCLLVWFSYWRRFFEIDAPVFAFFPLYFVLFSVFISYFLSNQCARLAPDQIELMRMIYGFAGMRALVLVLLVLASLLFTEHYLIYPIAMTLLLIRFAFSMCLEA